MLFSSSRQVARATYHAAVERWPNAKITPIYKFWARRAASILHPAHPCPHAPLALFPLQSGSQSPLAGAALLISRPWAVRDV